MATNPPVTVWQPTNGNGEYTDTGTYNIDDPSANLLVDPSGVFIVDTGVTFTLTPATVWAEDNSV